MAVIAMPREMGTLGKDVALGVAEALGLEVVHHELMERGIAERMDVGQSAVHQFLEGTPSLWERWKIDPKKLSHYTSEEMLQLAGKGNVVIRGWGAVSLLRRVPHVLCVRVCAPMAFRARVLRDRLGLDSDEIARREIVKNDNAHLRSAQMRNVSNWSDATNFDIVLNAERIPVSECVDLIKNLATSEAFSETRKSEAALADLLVETRVRNALSTREAGNLLSHGLEVFVSNGEVVVTGAVTNRDIAENAYHIVSATDGVTSVTKNVFVLTSSYGGI